MIDYLNQCSALIGKTATCNEDWRKNTPGRIQFFASLLVALSSQGICCVLPASFPPGRVFLAGQSTQVMVMLVLQIIELAVACHHGLESSNQDVPTFYYLANMFQRA